jgi:hypothetical protein
VYRQREVLWRERRAKLIGTRRRFAALQRGGDWQRCQWQGSVVLHMFLIVTLGGNTEKCSGGWGKLLISKDCY